MKDLAVNAQILFFLVMVSKTSQFWMDRLWALQIPHQEDSSTDLSGSEALGTLENVYSKKVPLRGLLLRGFNGSLSGFQRFFVLNDIFFLS